VYPLTEEERQQGEDCRWARHDPEVQAKYIGEFIVPYRRQIIAHGTDIEAVLAEAARVTGLKPDDLPVCGVDDPLMDIPH
jgi:hypothetical protein